MKRCSETLPWNSFMYVDFVFSYSTLFSPYFIHLNVSNYTEIYFYVRQGFLTIKNMKVNLDISDFYKYVK